jgi:hypothetical protein
MTKTNLLVDIGVFTMFLISTAPRYTGNLIHEWLGVAFAVTLIAHILFHWKWISQVGAKFFKNLWHVSRLQFVLDTLIFITFVILIVSGLAISRDVMSLLGFTIAAGRSWKFIHSTASTAAVILAGLHIAFNWNWVISSVKKFVVRPIASLFQPMTSKPVVVVETVENK